METLRRVGAIAAAGAAVTMLAIDSRWLVPLVLDRSGDPSLAAKALAVLWHAGIALLLATNARKGAATAAALMAFLGWGALVPTGAGAVLFRYWGGIDAPQTVLVVLCLTLQMVTMLSAGLSRLLSPPTARVTAVAGADQEVVRRPPVG
jgi:hypothetical protein